MKTFFGIIASLAACTAVVADSIQVNYYSDGGCQDYIGTQYIGNSCTGNLWGTQSMMIVCSSSNSCDGVQWSPTDSCYDNDAIGALDCTCNDANGGNNRQCWDVSSLGGLYGTVFVQADPYLP